MSRLCNSLTSDGWLTSALHTKNNNQSGSAPSARSIGLSTHLGGSHANDRIRPAPSKHRRPPLVRVPHLTNSRQCTARTPSSRVLHFTLFVAFAGSQIPGRTMVRAATRNRRLPAWAHPLFGAGSPSSFASLPGFTGRLHLTLPGLQALRTPAHHAQAGCAQKGQKSRKKDARTLLAAAFLGSGWTVRGSSLTCAPPRISPAGGSTTAAASDAGTHQQRKRLAPQVTDRPPSG